MNKFAKEVFPTKQYNLGVYEKSLPNFLSIKEKLENTRDAGFDFMEISIDETDEKLGRLKWDKSKRYETVQEIWETGIRINTMCLSGNRKYPIGSENEQIRNRGMEIMSDAITFAADIGVRVIQIAGYDEYYKPSNTVTKRLFTENLKKCVKLASRMGVVLAFETMETEFMNTVEKVMDYVGFNNSPYLQVYPDLGNITNSSLLYKHSVAGDLQTGKGHIAAMHLKETLPGIFREVPYGEGHVDFQGGIETAGKMGVNLYVGEFWCVKNENWRQQMEYAHDFLTQRLNKYYDSDLL
jgi:L-ribulose-5-phosphate 3-epimerase